MEKGKKEQMKKCDIFEDFQCFWLHTQNLRRFPGFVVVVVTFFS